MNLTLNGRTNSAAEWARLTGIPPATIVSRKGRGWNDEETLTVPVFSNDTKITKNDAELYLNDIERHQLPEELRVLMDGRRTKKHGQFIRSYFPKDFDKWYKEKYKPKKENELDSNVS